ncbi:MAG: apolipoprotein N-acyltransferase, partial [Gemmatimonadota bacterium]
PQLVGVAELVGARGVTFWIALSNGVLATAILHRKGARRNLAAPAFALVVLVPMAWGVWRAATLEMRAVGEVAVVQPNIPPEVKLDRDEATDSTMRALEALMPGLRAPVTLVVWPEVTLPEVVRAPEQESLRERVRVLAAAAGSDILLGGYGFRAAADRSAGGGGPGIIAERSHRPGEEGVRGPTIYNSAFVMTPSGLGDFEYSKRDLVPIIERVPFANPDWFPDRRYYGSLGRGGVESREPARAGGVAFGVLICYESIFAESSRAFRRAGADVLLNITNDAWYGRDVWYGRTTALWQHPAHMVMRAIENRVGVARAANTGISLFIDPVGRVYGRAPLFEPALGQAVVYTTDGLTLYARLGDVTGRGALFATLLLLFHAGRRGRRPVATGAQAGHGT